MFEAIQGPVLELAENLQGALLYLDAGAGEIAQTTLGLPFLLGLGVVHVCSLETASSDDGAYPLLATGQLPTRLAIFTTRLLTDAHSDLVRAVQAHPSVSSVSIFTSITEHAHACQSATELGVEAYREYAELLKADVRRARSLEAQSQGGTAGAVGGGVPSAVAGGAAAVAAGAEQQQQQPPSPAPLSVRVAFLPLLACCLDPGLFVLPAASSAAQRGVSGGRAAGFAASDPAADPAAGEGSSGGLALTAHALLALAAALGAPRPEPFPIGPVSTALAAELASLPSVSIPSAASAAATSSSGVGGGGGGGGSTSGPSSLALVLVDRALDLAAPCSHTDHPWDGMLAAAAARQAAAAAGRAAGAAGGQLAVWRPLELRAALPGADTVPLHVPWVPTDASDSGDTLSTSGSYNLYGVELLDPTDRTAISRVEAVATKPRREGLAALRRGLKEALRAEKLTPAVRSKAGAVQAAELKGLAESLAAAPGSCSRQRGIAALGLALADAMTSPAAAEWEAAAGLERSVLAALAGGEGGGGGGSEAAVQVLLDALAAARHSGGLLHVGHVLEVLPAAFSAAADSDGGPPSATSSSSAAAAHGGSCPFTAQQQATLRAALAEAVLECRKPAEALGGRLPADLVAALAARCGGPGDGTGGSEQAPPASSGGGAGQEAAAVQRRLAVVLDGLFAGLRYASGSRERLKTFRKVTHLDVFAENHGALNPLLRQVVRKVLHRAEVTDWQMQTASSGGGLVRGLLGGLMGASRALVGRAAGGGQLGGQQQHPGEYGIVLVFVVGGISAAEVREVRTELDEHVGPGKPRVILGGTSLLLPQDVTFHLAAAAQYT